MNTHKWLQKIMSPKFFYAIAGSWIPYTSILSILLLIVGSLLGLYFSPPDYQQGEMVRILYVHVPSAFLSLAIYTVLGCCSLITLVWRLKIADMIAAVSAPLGMMFTGLALITGALWGKPMWGTWWVWDARLTSELILLFLYIGYLGLRSLEAEEEALAKLSAILALVGLVNVPIVHYSVTWWYTLHQGSTVLRLQPLMPLDMLYPLWCMMGGFSFFYVTLLLINVRSEILRRERRTQWVLEIVNRREST